MHVTQYKHESYMRQVERTVHYIMFVVWHLCPREPNKLTTRIDCQAYVREVRILPEADTEGVGQNLVQEHPPLT